MLCLLSWALLQQTPGTWGKLQMEQGLARHRALQQEAFLRRSWGRTARHGMARHMERKGGHKVRPHLGVTGVNKPGWSKQ